MFYLKYFFKTLIKYPVKGSVFILSTLFLLFALGNKGMIDKNINTLFPSHKDGAFFYVLINGKENLGQISRKIKALPGVYKVDTLNKKEVYKKVKKILQVDEMKGLIKELSFDYFGMKIIYNQKLDVRSQELIRDYLKRYVGKNKITLGSIQKNNKEYLKKEKYLTLAKGKFWIVLNIFLFIVWAFSFISFGKVVTNMSYLIEQYQRKKHVKVKIISLGNILIFCLVAGVGLFFKSNGMIILLGAVFIQIISFAYIRNTEWEG